MLLLGILGDRGPRAAVRQVIFLPPKTKPSNSQKERETETDRDRDRDRKRETKRERKTHARPQIGRPRERERGRQTDSETERKRDRTFCLVMSESIKLNIFQGYIFWPFPPIFLSKLKNREEFEGGLEKRKGKRGKRRKKRKE